MHFQFFDISAPSLRLLADRNLLKPDINFPSAPKHLRRTFHSKTLQLEHVRPRFLYI